MVKCTELSPFQGQQGVKSENGVGVIAREASTCLPNAYNSTVLGLSVPRSWWWTRGKHTAPGNEWLRRQIDSSGAAALVGDDREARTAPTAVNTATKNWASARVTIDDDTGRSVLFEAKKSAPTNS